MKVGIFGSYNASSIGDTAILLGMLNMLQSLSITPENVVVFAFDATGIKTELTTYNQKYSKVKVVQFGPTLSGKPSIKNALPTTKGSLVKRLAKKLPQGLKGRVIELYAINSFRKWFKANSNIVNDNELDLLIVGGGNLLMDLFPTWPVKLQSIIAEYHKQQVPVIFFGVGAGPINTWFGKLLLGKVLNMAQAVWVRDHGSKAYLEKQELAKGKIEVSPDVALNLPVNPDRKALGNTLEVGLNLVRYDGKELRGTNAELYQKYLNLYYNFVSALVKKYEVKFNFISTNLSDLTAVHDLIAFCAARDLKFVYEIYEPTDVKAIEKQMAKQDFLLATRLHAALLGAKAGARVLCLAYQPKVEGVLKLIGLEASSLSMNKLLAEPELLVHTFEKNLNPDSRCRLTQARHLELSLANINTLQAFIEKEIENEEK